MVKSTTIFRLATSGRTLTKILLPLLLLLAGSTGVQAEDPDEPPYVQGAQAGILSRIRDRFWAPVTVRVINKGPSQDAVVMVEAEGRKSHQKVAVQRAVTLPAYSSRYIDIPAYTDIGTSGGLTNTQFMPVHLTDGKLHTWSTLETFAGAGSEQHLMFLCVDERMRSYRFLEKIRIAGRSNDVVRSISAPDKLPQRPLYYAGIDVIILGDLEDNFVSDMQAAAIRSWVERGGILLVTGSDPQPLLELPALASILPVRYVSARETERIPQLDAYGSPFHAEEGIYVHRMVVIEGDTMLGTVENPCVVSRDVGMGRVVAVGFDMGTDTFQTWDGATAFVNSLLREFSPISRYGTRALELGQTVENVLGELTGKEVLPRKKVSVYLAGLIVVLMFPIFGMARSRRPERAWIVSVVLAVAAGGGAIAYATAHQAHPLPTLNEVYVAEARSGVKGMSVQAAVGVFSPGDETFLLNTPTEESWWRPSSSPIRPPDTLRFVVDQGRLQANLRVRANDVRYLYWEGPDPEAHVPQAHFHFGADGLHVDLKSTGGGAMEEAFIRLERLVVPLGDLEAGEDATTLTVRPDKAQRDSSYSKRTIRRTRDEMRDQLRELFMPKSGTEGVLLSRPSLVRLIDAASHHDPAFYYWSDSPRFPLPSEAFGSRRSMGLCRIIGRTSYGTDRVLFPQGTLPRHVVKRSGAIRVGLDGSIVGHADSALICHWRLPEDAPSVQTQGLRLFCGMSSERFDYDVYLVPAARVNALPEEPGMEMDTAGWTHLGAVSVHEVEDPETYFDPKSRQVTAVVFLRKRPGSELTGTIIAANKRLWVLDNIDLELEGTPL